MIFYNGFNLLIDTLLVFTGMVIAYRIAKREGYLLGYAHGQEDTKKTMLSILTSEPYSEELPSDFWEPVRKNHEEYL